MHLSALLSILYLLQARPAKLHFWVFFEDGEHKVPKLGVRENNSYGSIWLLVKPIPKMDEFVLSCLAFSFAYVTAGREPLLDKP